jgi:hypothetical protein
LKAMLANRSSALMCPAFPARNRYALAGRK